MQFQELNKTISAIARRLPMECQIDLKNKIKNITHHPFNKHEYLLMYCFSKGVIDFTEYETIRSLYNTSPSNKNLHLFEMQHRKFGQEWGEDYLLNFDSRFNQPCKAKDVEFCGEYDLVFNDKKIEAKACRAVHKHKKSSLITKALISTSEAPYTMNFQQIKFGLCDYFIFIGVWTDLIRQWAIPANYIEVHPRLSRQHRGGVEFQLTFNKKSWHEINRYEILDSSNLTNLIV